MEFFKKSTISLRYALALILPCGFSCILACRVVVGAKQLHLKGDIIIKITRRNEMLRDTLATCGLFGGTAVGATGVTVGLVGITASVIVGVVVGEYTDVFVGMITAGAGITTSLCASMLGNAIKLNDEITPVVNNI